MVTVKNSLLVLAALVLIVSAVSAAGCRPRGPGGGPSSGGVVESALGGGVLRSADAAVAAPTRSYFAAGLGLLVAGGLAFIAGARAAGVAGMALGCSVSAVGVVIVRYPWAILLAFVLALAAAALALFDRWRKARELARNTAALAAAAQVIQNIPEGKAVKQALANLGTEVAEQVRDVVTPIKDRLRKEGKIGAQA